MTVVTGPTGSGKTTFLSQLSLDFATQSDKPVNCLWGSFEVKNTRLMQKMLHQYSRAPLPISSDVKETEKRLDELCEEFEELPLYFMNFHGGTDVHSVIDAMEYAVYVHSVSHIILDNLQFMLDRTGGDKYDAQDEAIGLFRKFASDKNVHVILVCHPRKEEEVRNRAYNKYRKKNSADQPMHNYLLVPSLFPRSFPRPS
jgi:twinkle protein